VIAQYSGTGRIRSLLPVFAYLLLSTKCM
jgi:hypothetical protein